MLLTLLGLPTSPYQLPNTINLSFSYFKFVIASECGDHIAFCSRLKMKKWRKLEQHSIENHSCMALTRFLKFSLDNTVTWHYKHESKRDLSEIECTSSGNSNMLIANWYIAAFIRSLQRVEGNGVERRQWTAIVHSCQNHVDNCKQWLTTSAVGSIPP